MGLFDKDGDDDHRPAILKELDDFNTAPGFGMMGILEEQLGAQEKEATVKEEKQEEPEAKENDYEKIYAPLNSSIQELSTKIDSRLSEVDRRVDEVRGLASRPAPQTPPPVNYDPEEPVTRGSYEDRIARVEQFAYEQALGNEFTKAHLALAQFKQAHPDCKITPKELTDTWNRGIGTDLQKARSVNWDSLLYQNHHQQMAPEREKEISQLRKENEDLKKQLSSSKPSSSQRKSEPISPAVGRAPAARSIESPTNHTEADEAIHLPSFRKGKSFKSYGREVARSQGIRL